jgi:hypothetical protein
MFIAVDWIMGKVLFGDSSNLRGILLASPNTSNPNFVSIQCSERCLLVTIKKVRVGNEILFNIPSLSGNVIEKLKSIRDKCLLKWIFHIQSFLLRFPFLRVGIYLAVIMISFNLVDFHSHQDRVGHSSEKNLSLHELHSQFIRAINTHPRTEQQFRNKAFESESRFLRVANYWIAPMHSALSDEAWYLVTTAHKGFAIENETPKSTVLQPLQSCLGKFWFAVPFNTAAVVFHSETVKPEAVFTLTNQKPTVCETSR